MSGLSVNSVSMRFGPVEALKSVALDVPHGTFVCLLGPSGCGKTTLLRIVAGLESPTTGRIIIDGEDITDCPAHKRDFGMVFQSLALFPHLTVAGNVGYPLKIRGTPRAAREAQVAELLALVRLPDVERRAISQLSGGQRQRVAIARALALKPRLFLLDEPLSALDAKLREAMQVELRQLQERLGITTIVVTHDQREAMTMADLVVVMKDGEIRQVARPIEIYRRPADSFVADFIGMTNLIEGNADGAGTVVVPGGRLGLAGLPQAKGPVNISVRPEDVHVLPGRQAGDRRLAGTVTFVRDLGASVETRIDCSGLEIVAVATPRERPDVAPGDAVTVEFPPEACVVLAR